MKAQLERVEQQLAKKSSQHDKLQARYDEVIQYGQVQLDSVNENLNSLE